jgi:hypothetical protein
MSGRNIRQREQEILTGLTDKVRLLSQRQIADHWYAGDVPNARRCLRRLAQQGLVCRQLLPAQSMPLLTAPLVNWRPADETPDFGSVAYRCQARWRGRALRPSVVWVATDKALGLYGGPRQGVSLKPLQVTHDLGVAQVWLHLHHAAPAWAEAWRGEDLLSHTRAGEKCPDAFVVNAAEEVVLVIEFGGRYDAARIAEFHHDCAQRALPYQLW